MLKEFKEFAIKGNVLDMAVGVILGVAFGKIVSSLVGDLILPPVGMILGKVDFTNLFLSLNGLSYASLDEARKAGAPTINYGVFLNTLLDFAIVAFAVFLLVQLVNRLKTAPVPAPPDTKLCAFCATAIPLRATRCPHCTSELRAA